MPPPPKSIQKVVQASEELVKKNLDFSFCSREAVSGNFDI